MRIDQGIEQPRDRKRRQDDDQAIERIIDSRQDAHRSQHLRRQRQCPARGSPNQAHQFVEEQQQAERAEHLVEMIAPIQTSDRDHFEHHPGNQRGDDRQDQRQDKASGQGGEGGGEIGAEHVQRAVRQVDQVHDAEDQRQSGRQQKQQHAKLHAVEALLDEIQHGLCYPVPPRRRAAGRGFWG